MSTYETQMRTLTALQAENAALKEQVARLEDINRKLCDKTNTLTIQSARLEETITTLQAKSAALVDALERIGDTACGEASHQYIALTALAALL